MDQQNHISEKTIFFTAVFIAGLCSLIYELLISTTSSYFLGDSIKQFSLTIGVYMAAMGLGSWLSKYLEDDLLEWFVKIEVLLGLVGGISVPLLYWFFDLVSSGIYQWLMLGLTLLIGVLTGFEIPILVRIMKTYYPLKTNLANVLSLDYVGALVATLIFPFILLPFVGVFRTSVIFGLANIILGLLIYRFITQHLSIKRKNWIENTTLICILFFIALFIFSGKLLKQWEDQFYSSRIIYSKQTPYQKLVMTKNKDDLRLYINRIIQFSALDEYRYHESLALVPLNAAPSKKNVLILGGGEGLLAREVIRHPQVERVTIVDLDPEVFRLARENNYLKELNRGVLTDPKVTLQPTDAMQFLKNTKERFDVILSDLPDPSSDAVARLYSTFFFSFAKKCLKPKGVFATQATSPFHTRRAFWCIYETLKASGFNYVYPYHVYVPTFGDWGFVLASSAELQPQKFASKMDCRYLDDHIVENMFYFERDISNPGKLMPNYLDQPALLHYFIEDWEVWKRDKKQ
ncbi:MAG: polyamine aminopropyltransferase [Saprospiraceae bacterium]